MAADTSKQQVIDYTVKRNIWPIVTLVLFALDVAAVALFQVLDPTVVLALMVALTAGTVGCAINIKEESKTERISVIEDGTGLDMDALMKGLARDGFELVSSDGSPATRESWPMGCFAMSQELNHLFTRFPIEVRAPKSPYSLPEKVVPYAGYLKEDRNRELERHVATRPDKEVCGLASDISPEMFSDDGSGAYAVVTHVTRYSVQVTDDAFNKIIANKLRIADKIVFRGRDLSIDDEGRLMGLADAKGANEIDIHSLIVSSDGYVMLSKGTDAHPLRAGKAIASASCSLLPSEVKEKPLQESMIDSIHAKIKVLYNIPAGTDMRSSFCGFARMLSRGGAPEFYCLTFLDMTKDEIEAAHHDKTSMFIDSLLRPALADVEAGEDLRDAMKRAIREARDAAGENISVSAQALACATIGAMEDERTAGKVLRRLGLIEDEMDVPIKGATSADEGE